MAYFGNRFLELRNYYGLKQKGVAKVLQVKENTYAKWERGSNDISLESLNTLANYYNVDLDYLLGITSKPRKTPLQKIDYKTLSKRLLLLRKEVHYTQTKLSQKLGFVQTTYSSFETGARIPTAFKLFHIAQFYQVSYDYLVGRCEEREILEEKVH